MYILSLIFMVKPIKLYISVFIANSDCNGQKWQHWGRRRTNELNKIMTDKNITSKLNKKALRNVFLNNLSTEIDKPRTSKLAQSLGYKWFWLELHGDQWEAA